MGRSRRRSVAQLVLAGWLLAGGFAEPVAGEAHTFADGREAAHVEGPEAGGTPAASSPSVPTASALAEAFRCPSRLSCGYQCTAQLAVSFCVRLIKVKAGVKFGGAELSPTVRFECWACDCWYIGPGPNGRVFKRTVEFRCAGSIGGLTLQ